MNSIIAKYREIKEDNPLRIAYSKRKENMVTNYNTDTLNDCPKSTFRTVWGGVTLETGDACRVAGDSDSLLA